ncbi:MAG: glycosyltransferase family 2 protein [Rhizomicrobium sp.]
MKISVVTPSFNSQATIAATIRSFLAQDHRDKEMLVIDGGSSDATLAIAREFASPLIGIVSEKDRGVYDAMNKGLKLYGGDAVGFLNANDTFHDARSLSRIAQALEAAEAVHGGVRMVADRRTGRTLRFWKGEPFEPGKFRRGWMPPHPSFYIRRSLADRTGQFDLSYDIAADYDFMLRALEFHAASTACISEALVDFTVGGKSSGSLIKVLKGNLECLRSRRANLGAPLLDWAFFLKPGLKLLRQHWALRNLRTAIARLTQPV